MTTKTMVNGGGKAKEKVKSKDVENPKQERCKQKGQPRKSRKYKYLSSMTLKYRLQTSHYHSSDIMNIQENVSPNSGIVFISYI